MCANAHKPRWNSGDLKKKQIVFYSRQVFDIILKVRNEMCSSVCVCSVYASNHESNE